MGNSVRVDASMNDKLSRPLKDIEDSWKRFQKYGAQGIAIGAGAAVTAKAFNVLQGAVEGAAGAVVDSVKAAIDEDASIARMRASLAANVTGFAGNTDAIEKNIASRMKLGFTDDALRDSFTTLVTATHDVNKAFEFQQAAMDLSRLKGISLGDASTALVRVEAGQYRMLKSLGIVLKDGATATDALAAVQKAAAGQADAYSKTTAGAMDRATAKWDALQEKLGHGAAPAVQGVSDALTGLADVLDKVGGGNGDPWGNLAMGWEALTGSITSGGFAMWATQRQGAAALEEAAKIAGNAADESADKQRNLGRHIVDMGSEAERVADGPLDTLGGRIYYVRDAAGRATDKVKDFRSALQDAGKAASDATFGTDTLKLKYQETQLALQDQIDKLHELEAIKNPTRQQQEDILTLKQDINDSKASVIDLGTQLVGVGGIKPTDLISTMDTLGIKLANGAQSAQDLLHYLQLIAGTSAGNAYDSTTRIGGHASGGSIPPYGTSVIGENGPEVIRLGSAGASVNPSPSMGGGGGSTVVVNFSSFVPPSPAQMAEAARVIAPALAVEMRRRGLLTA